MPENPPPSNPHPATSSPYLVPALQRTFGPDVRTVDITVLLGAVPPNPSDGHPSDLEAVAVVTATDHTILMRRPGPLCAPHQQHTAWARKVPLDNLINTCELATLSVRMMGLRWAAPTEIRRLPPVARPDMAAALGTEDLRALDPYVQSLLKIPLRHRIEVVRTLMAVATHGGDLQEVSGRVHLSVSAVRKRVHRSERGLPEGLTPPSKHRTLPLILPHLLHLWSGPDTLYLPEQRNPTGRYPEE